MYPLRAWRSSAGKRVRRRAADVLALGVCAIAAAAGQALASPDAAQAASRPSPAPGSALAAAAHRQFLTDVRAQMPVLHEDLDDGFPLQRVERVLGYEAQTAGVEPRFTCGRPTSLGSDTPCPAAARADLGTIGFDSKIDHLDYPAPFNTRAQEVLAGSVDQDPTMYFFGKRDPTAHKNYAYWFFYGYNYFDVTASAGVTLSDEIDLHEGDLEHVVVYTDAHDQPVAYQFHEHDTERDFAADDPRVQTDGAADDVAGYDGHIRVYAARGSHASETACGLFNTAGAPGVRDGTCGTDSTAGVTGSPAQTAAYLPADTPLVNLDLKTWACFGGRLGASDILPPGLGLAPLAPLVQTGDCPNLYARRGTAAGAVGVFEPTPDAFAGIDSCADWERSSLSPGFILVVCDPSALRDHFSQPVPAASAASIAITQPDRTGPTATDTPAYVLEPNAAALAADTISASTPAQVDVYVASTSADAGVVEDAHFDGVELSSPLHISAVGSRWTLSDQDDRVIGRQTPVVTDCPLSSVPFIVGLAASICDAVGPVLAFADGIVGEVKGASG